MRQLSAFIICMVFVIILVFFVSKPAKVFFQSILEGVIEKTGILSCSAMMESGALIDGKNAKNEKEGILKERDYVLLIQLMKEVMYDYCNDHPGEAFMIDNKTIQCKVLIEYKKSKGEKWVFTERDSDLLEQDFEKRMYDYCSDNPDGTLLEGIKKVFDFQDMGEKHFKQALEPVQRN